MLAQCLATSSRSLDSRNRGSVGSAERLASIAPVPSTEATWLVASILGIGERLDPKRNFGGYFLLAKALPRLKLEPMWNERRLPRLSAEYYRAYAHVLWTHAVKDRREGWLNPSFHVLFRETLLHTCARYHLGCARYILMPDHLHLIWVGAIGTSDQLKATKFLRTHLPLEWQKQAHDHVFREEERQRGHFADACNYLRENPVRAALVESATKWPYAGSLVPGYPDLNPWESDAFWRCYLAYRRSLEDAE